MDRYEAVLRLNAEQEDSDGSDISDPMEKAAYRFELELGRDEEY